MPAAIAWGNLFNGAKISTAAYGFLASSSFDPGYPPSNVADPDPSKVSRFNFTRDATPNQYALPFWAFSATAGGQGTVRVYGALNVRLPASATNVGLSLFTYAAIGVDSLTYSAAVRVPIPDTTDRFNLFAIASANVTAGAIGVDVFCPAGTVDYIEVGTLWASRALVVGAVEEKWVSAPIDGSKVERSDGGAHLADINVVRDVFRCSLPKLTVNEALGNPAAPTDPCVRTLQFEAGRHDPVVLLPRTSSHFYLQTLAKYGALKAVPQLRHAGGDYYDADVEVEQIR